MLLENEMSLRTDASTLQFGKNRYGIGFDQNKAVGVLVRLGMPKDAAESVQVEFDRNSMVDGGVYAHRHGKKVIEIFPNHQLSVLEKNLALAEKISNGSPMMRGEHFEGLYTKELERYLATVYPERALWFARKLLLNTASREINETFIHEAKHAMEFDDPSTYRRANVIGAITFFSPAVISLTLGWMFLPNINSRVTLVGVGLAAVLAMGLMIGEYLRTQLPQEVRAKAAGKQFKNNLDYQSIAVSRIRT